jgi:hypothetical protein
MAKSIVMSRREALLLSATAGSSLATGRPALASDSVKTGAHQEQGNCSTPRSAIANTQYGKVRGFLAVSGTLAFAMGAGKAIISTPYWHATELLDDGRGALVPFEEPGATAAAVIDLMENAAGRQTMRQRAYLFGRDMVWTRVARSYMRTFEHASVDRTQTVRQGFSAQAVEQNTGNRLVNA